MAVATSLVGLVGLHNPDPGPQLEAFVCPGLAKNWCCYNNSFLEQEPLLWWSKQKELVQS